MIPMAADAVIEALSQIFPLVKDIEISRQAADGRRRVYGVHTLKHSGYPAWGVERINAMNGREGAASRLIRP